MLRKLYLVGLATLLLAAGLGLAYACLLAAAGDARGLSNIGKLLLVTLYSGYRLRSILEHHYQIYRGWETERVKGAKRLLHGAMSACLGLLACSGLAALAGYSLAAQAVLLFLLLLLAIFLALETVNALHSDPMAAHE